MNTLDWTVLICTILLIVGYGLWKSRGIKNIKGFFLADRKMPWYHVGFSVMATQASAITFLSAPAQGYTDGLRFVQFYFGLPLAMVFICITFIPIYQKLQVYTAYEYLEKRFDIRTRLLTSFLFLLQRGLSTGITIYAPALVLSTILHVDITVTTFFMGGLVILYTYYGGAKAVSHTQLLQMTIIFSGLFIAAYMVIHLLPEGIGLREALEISGKLGKLNTIDTGFDLNNRYNIWSGIIGGFFLQLAYFGADQSQVGRYLTGSSVAQSRLGLLMNGVLKIPMQFLILLTGVLVFTFYQFFTPPVFFNKVELEKVKSGSYATTFDTLNQAWIKTNMEKTTQINKLLVAIKSEDAIEIEAEKEKLIHAQNEISEIKKEAVKVIIKSNPDAEVNDSNYIFLNFVIDNLPHGLTGLLIAIIFLAAMGSTASGLSALTSICVVDFYKRFKTTESTASSDLFISRLVTAAWGIFCIVVALYASRLGNLIEAVNILGSLFYGTILGIFLTAFFLKSVRGKAVFIASLITEMIVIFAWWNDYTAFLWLNVIGSLLVMLLSFIIQQFIPAKANG